MFTEKCTIQPRYRVVRPDGPAVPCANAAHVAAVLAAQVGRQLSPSRVFAMVRTGATALPTGWVVEKLTADARAAAPPLQVVRTVASAVDATD